MSRRVKCWMCGALTERPRTILVTAAIAPGVDAPGARPKEQPVCESCYGLLDDDEDDDAYEPDEEEDD